MNIPFRLGTTSFIYPASWIVNVQRLAGRVDDIEILLFEAEADADFPNDEEVSELLSWKERANLTYTVHAPLNMTLANADDIKRRQSIEMLRRVVRTTAILNPEGWVVHVYPKDRDEEPSPHDTAWCNRARRSLAKLLEHGVPAERICVESLHYDFALIEPVIEDLGLSVALDIGHLPQDGDFVEPLLRNFHRTRIIQWHGTDAAGRDHRSLRFYPRDRARDLLSMLLREDYRGILTIEVFREHDLEESLTLVQNLLIELGA